MLFLHQFDAESLIEEPNLLDLTSFQAFFGLLEVVLLEDVLSGISRLTDPTSTGQFNNLVLGQLLTGLDTLVADLKTKLGTIDSACTDIRKIRDKVLAHRDFNAALDPQNNPLPPISINTAETALKAIADYMNSFQEPFTKTTIRYTETLTGLGDAEGLVGHLRRAVEHLKLQSDGKVPPVGALSAEYVD